MNLCNLPLAIVCQFTFDNSLLWQSQLIFKTKNQLLLITHIALLGLRSDIINHDEPTLNLVLLIFKLQVSSSRGKHVLYHIKEIKRQNVVYLPTAKKERHIKISVEKK